MFQGRTWGARVPRVSSFYLFEHGRVAYQIDRDNEYNRMQVIFLP